MVCVGTPLLSPCVHLSRLRAFPKRNVSIAIDFITIHVLTYFHVLIADMRLAIVAVSAFLSDHSLTLSPHDYGVLFEDYKVMCQNC